MYRYAYVFYHFHEIPLSFSLNREKTNQINTAMLILPRHDGVICILLEIIYLYMACGVHIKLNTKPK